MKWDQLLSSMDEETFKDFRYQVSCEERKRMAYAVKTFPELNQEEKEMAIMGDTLGAIKAYRSRIGVKPGSNSMVVGIAEAKEKIEQFLNPPANYMKEAPDNHWD